MIRIEPATALVLEAVAIAVAVADLLPLQLSYADVGMSGRVPYPWV